MENLNSSRIRVKFMNPLLEIDIYGYSVEDTKRFFNTILRIDKERNDIERNITPKDTLSFSIADSAGGTGYSTAAGRGGSFYDPLVDEGQPLPFSSVESDRTHGEDTHGEGGLFISSLEDKDEDNG